MKLKLFQTDQSAQTLVVTPNFDGRAFRYQELQVEVNAIRSQLLKAGPVHLVVDLSHMDYIGSEFIGAVISMLRETKSRGGRACFCSARPQTIDVLKSAGLFQLWPHFETREAALNSFPAATS